MKINPPVKGFSPVAGCLAAVFIAGCATAPPVDWSSQVGHCTYAQAVHELGPPDRQIRLSSGATEFRWFQPYGGANSGGGMGNNVMNNSFGPSQNLGAGLDNHYLQLTFDTNGVLTAWSRNY